jgi:hypothetical protein
MPTQGKLSHPSHSLLNVEDVVARDSIGYLITLPLGLKYIKSLDRAHGLDKVATVVRVQRVHSVISKLV